MERKGENMMGEAGDLLMLQEIGQKKKRKVRRIKPS